MMRQSESEKLRSKSRLFKIVATLLPLFLFIIIELFLRLFNYGHDLSVFVPDKQLTACVELNPHISERYFSDKANGTMGNTEPFEKIKPANVLRFFVLGESTTIGFPYMHNGAFHRWLRYRLMQTYPGKNFEIINLSLTAVNSFTVRDIAQALPAYQPDGVLIYCGHNEYYGAMGVASTSSLGNSPALAPLLIRLRQLRVIQLVSNLLPSTTAKNIDTSKNLMERMVANKTIPFGSTMYKRGIANFSANMDAVCMLFTKAHIPVFLSTVVSNERDTPPFIDDDKKQALSYYNKGKAESKLDNIASAKKAFIRAKDYDQLRFRAPEAINEVIINLCRKYTSVKLVNTYKLFEATSPQGIIGDDLILEHVHPNLAGYALMSDAFYSAMLHAGVLPNYTANAMTLQQLITQMPVTPADSSFGVYTIDILKQRWPFNEKIKLPAPRNFNDSLGYALATGKLKWNEMMDLLMTRYEQQKDFSKMLKVAEAVMLEFPLDPTFYLAAGDLSIRNNNKIKAENYLGRAFSMQPNMQLAQKLFSLELSLQHLDQAMVYVDYGLQTSPGSNSLAGTKRLLERMIVINSGKRADRNDYREMANAYHMFGQQEIAAHYLQLSNQL